MRYNESLRLGSDVVYRAMKSFSNMTELDATVAEAFTNDDFVRDAAHNLVQVFKELAGSEALTRALVAERSENPEGALLWAKVYLGLQSS